VEQGREEFKGGIIMEYIKVKEFLKQPKEVQKVFLEWWVPKKLDLFVWDTKGFSKTYLVNVYDQCNILPCDSPNIWNEKSQCIPLLTEGQLRKFIADKLGKTNISCQSIASLNFELIVEFETSDSDIASFDIPCKNLLDGYWEVACMVAQDLVKREKTTNEAMKESFVKSIGKAIRGGK
jgi:hypothetical protein